MVFEMLCGGSILFGTMEQTQFMFGTANVCKLCVAQSSTIIDNATVGVLLMSVNSEKHSVLEW